MEHGKSSGYIFRYFSKNKNFTKEHIIQELSSYPQAKLFIQDDINLKHLSRDYLFSVTNIYNFTFLINKK